LIALLDALWPGNYNAVDAEFMALMARTRGAARLLTMKRARSRVHGG